MNEPRYSETIKPDERAMTTALVGRRLAYPFARLARRVGLSANAVTVMAGVCWMASLPLVVAAGAATGSRRFGGGVLWFFCGFLWNAGYVLDMADGSLARMTGTASRRGFYLDYVFHLLFKPAFPAALGIGLFLSRGGGLGWLLLAVLAIPANWSASASAVEHVLCEETGLGRLGTDGATGSAGRRLWLGVTEMHDDGREKASDPRRLARTLAAEVFSYYGQFSFFSLTILLDLVLSGLGIRGMPVTAVCFAVLVVTLTVRVPFRVWREYCRIAASDEPRARG